LVVLGHLKTQHKPHDASYIHRQVDKCDIQFLATQVESIVCPNIRSAHSFTVAYAYIN